MGSIINERFEQSGIGTGTRTKLANLVEQAVRSTIVQAFHKTAKLRRKDIFPSDALVPVTALEDANTAAPGWVGTAWNQGTLLIGINPGGGGDAYRRNPDDDRLYTLLRSFRDAQIHEQEDAFARSSTAWINVQRSHNIWRIIDPILKATDESVDEVAFMNILPFRTRMDKAAPVAVLPAAWERSAKEQVKALAPRRIIALGKKAWDVLVRFDLPSGANLILFRRGIGDSYIPADSIAVLAELTAASTKNR